MVGQRESPEDRRRNSRHRWIQTATSSVGAIAGAVSVIVALVAIGIANDSNAMSLEANSVALEANSIAIDAAQRYELTESFTDCAFGMTASIEVTKDGWNEDAVTSGQSRFVVLTNTGRLSVLIVGAVRTPDPASAEEISLRFLRLSNGASEPEQGALYLEPGEAVAAKLSFDTDGNGNQLVPYSYLVASGDAESIEPGRAPWGN